MGELFPSENSIVGLLIDGIISMVDMVVVVKFFNGLFDLATRVGSLLVIKIVKHAAKLFLSNFAVPICIEREENFVELLISDLEAEIDQHVVEFLHIHFTILWFAVVEIEKCIPIDIIFLHSG